MDKNVFKIPVAKFINLYDAFNPRAVFLVNLSGKDTDEILEQNIKFRDDVILENLEGKAQNFSLRAPLKSNTIFYLGTFNPNFEKIIGVEEIFSIFLICSKTSDLKMIKKYTQKYSDKTVGIIVL